MQEITCEHPKDAVYVEWMPTLSSASDAIAETAAWRPVAWCGKCESKLPEHDGAGKVANELALVGV